MSLMILDIATIPDFELGARLYGLHDLSEKDISRVMSTKSREMNDYAGAFPQHLQRVLSISVLYQDKKGIKIWSVGDAESNEADLLKILERYVDEYKPAVVTWSGDRKIFPLFNYRYLSHGIPLPIYADQTNLMAELAGESGNEFIPLHDFAVLAGSPEYSEMTDEDILSNYLLGDIEPVRNYLELNLINTWQIYQRWQLINGNIDQADFDTEKQLLINTLQEEGKVHLTSFVETNGTT